MNRNKLVTTLKRTFTAAAMLSIVSTSIVAADLLDYVPAETPFYFGSKSGVDVPEILHTFAETDEHSALDMFTIFDLLPDDFLPSVNGMSFIGALTNFNQQLIYNPDVTLESSGYTNPLVYAVYLSGASPVVRYQLTDEEKLRQTLDQWNLDHYLEYDQRELGGVYYYRYPLFDEYDGASVLPAAVLAIHDNMLVFTVDLNDTDLLASALGINLPNQSLASSGAIDNLNQQWKYTDAYSGFVDVQRSFRQLLASDSDLRKQLAKILPGSIAETLPVAFDSPECRAELDSIAAVVPRFVTGMRASSLDDKNMYQDLHGAFEVNHPAIMTALQQLRGHVSKPDVKEPGTMALSVGFDLAQLTPSLQTIISTIDLLQPDCAALAEAKDRYLARARQLMIAGAGASGMAVGFKGFNYVIFDAGVVENEDTGMSLNVNQSDYLIQLTSDMPQSVLTNFGAMWSLDQLVLPSDGTPVRFADHIQDVPPIFPEEVRVALKSKHLGMFHGPESEAAFTQIDAETTHKNGLMYWYVNLDSYYSMVDAATYGAGIDSAGFCACALMTLGSNPDLSGKAEYTMDITSRGLEMTAQMNYDLTARPLKRRSLPRTEPHYYESEVEYESELEYEPDHDSATECEAPDEPQMSPAI